MPWVCFAVTEHRKTWKNNDHLSSKFFVLTTYLTSSVIYYWIDARSLRVAVAFPPPPQGETRRLRRTVMTSDQNVNHWHHQQSFSRTPLTQMITHATTPPPHRPLLSTSIPRTIYTYRYGCGKKKELLRQSLFPAFFQSYKFSLTQS